MVEGRKIIQNYFQIIFELRRLKIHRLVFTRVSGGEGKRRKEFAEWYVEWRAEWHNYAKYDLRGE